MKVFKLFEVVTILNYFQIRVDALQNDVILLCLEQNKMTVLRFAKTPVNIKLERDVRPLLYELIYIDHVSSFERNDLLYSPKENKTQIKNFSLSD